MIIEQTDTGIQALRSRIARFGLVGCICLALTACQKSEEAPRDYKLLATDVHVSVADHHMVLPFIALGDYRGGQSFSLKRARDATEQAYELAELMRELTDPERPKSFDRLSLEIQTYGLNDGDIQQRQICPMLTREWAHSVCDNLWAVVQQSLPHRIELVDLSRLRIVAPEPRIPRCAGEHSPRPAMPTRTGDAVLICEEEIGGSAGKSYVAVVRIDGNLGAAWSVWRGGRPGETVEATAEREGKAIVALARYGLGEQEDFSRLYNTLCGLRAPNSSPGIHRLDCGDTARR